MRKRCRKQNNRNTIYGLVGREILRREFPFTLVWSSLGQDFPGVIARKVFSFFSIF
jgi:hypothetical protein